MKIILLLIIIFIILILFSNKIERMTNIVPYSDQDKLIPDVNIKCCFVEKKYLPDNNYLNGGNFKYVYTNKENNECDPSLYDLNNNQQLLIDGVNNWSNEKCNEQSTNLGSCRLINNECVDFVDKKFCDSVPEMNWSNKTCNNPLEFVWKDRIIRNVPERDKDDGSYIMFPEKLKVF
jgi:hypothetical protein